MGKEDQAKRTEKQGDHAANQEEKTVGHREQAEEQEGIRDPNKIVQNIIENYRKMEESIVSQLGINNKFHGTTTGTAREDTWLKLFEMIVPKKFVLEHSVFIIDSFRHISHEVDLAIIDNTYTPYIFQHGRMKYVPIEAVAAVVECKSQSASWEYQRKAEAENDEAKTAGQGQESKEKKAKGGLKQWCKSIELLRTSRDSVVRMATGPVIRGRPNRVQKEPHESYQTSTRPIRIFCGYGTKSDLENIKEFFDFVLIAKEEGDKKRIDVAVTKEGTLQDWYLKLDHYEFDSKEVKWKDNERLVPAPAETLKGFHLEDLKIESGGEDISLLTFNFQLNQLLMLINNPIMFPHRSYAQMFSGEKREMDC